MCKNTFRKCIGDEKFDITIGTLNGQFYAYSKPEYVGKLPTKEDNKAYTKIFNLLQEMINQVDMASILSEYIEEDKIYGEAFMPTRTIYSKDLKKGHIQAYSGSEYAVTILKNRDDVSKNKIWHGDIFMDWTVFGHSAISKMPQIDKVSICNNCNIQNEYIDYDANYTCTKCKVF